MRENEGNKASRYTHDETRTPITISIPIEVVLSASPSTMATTAAPAAPQHTPSHSAPRRRRSVPIPTIPASAIEGDKLHFLNHIGEDSKVEVLKDQDIQPVSHQFRMKTTEVEGKEVTKVFILLTFMESGNTVYLRPTHDLITQGLLAEKDGSYVFVPEELGYRASDDTSVAGTFLLP